MLYSNEHVEVLSLLDDSAGYPSVGTVFDTTELFAFSLPIGGMMHMFTSAVIDDPEARFASQFSITPLFINTFMLTDEDMKDVVTPFGGRIPCLRSGSPTLRVGPTSPVPLTNSPNCWPNWGQSGPSVLSH